MRETIYEVTKMLFVGLFLAPIYHAMISMGWLSVKPEEMWAMDFLLR